MKQLVQLRENKDVFQKHKVNVIVVFREEKEGQEGLKKVVKATKADFILALDLNAQHTGRYSPGERVHDSYIIDSSRVIRVILPGKRYDRASIEEFEKALARLRKRDRDAGSAERSQ